MYSVRRSRKAACACLLRCLRSSEVAYILRRLVSPIFDIVIGDSIAAAMTGKAIGIRKAHRFTAAFALLLLGLFLGICLRQTRFGRRSDRVGRTIARSLCLAHGGRHICYETISHLRPPYPSVQIEGHRGAKSCERCDKGRSKEIAGGSGRLDALVLGSRSAGSKIDTVCMGF